MYFTYALALLGSSLLHSAAAHPVAGGQPHTHSHKRAVDRSLNTLVAGNQRFREKIAASADPTLLKTLADEGQAPPFMFLGCADSRVNDGTIFDAVPGTFFTERNIANQYHKTDINAQATLAYGLTELGVEHVIVMGHYGCGGVGASIASAPKGGVDAASASIQSWIQPIRNIYESSTRAEIVTLREANANATVVEEPEIDDPGFKALVEENVKATVKSIAQDSVILNIYQALAEAPAVEAPANGTVPVNGTAPAERLRRRSGSEEGVKNVFIHGLIYDITTGTISDLGISVGPPGVEIPTVGSLLAGGVPQPAVEKQAQQTADIIHTFIPPKAKRALEKMWQSWGH